MKNILISDHKTEHTLSRLYTKIINKYFENKIELWTVSSVGRADDS